jgi:TRAP-type C4-dicarboxylate transport system permease small subunit
MLLDAFRFGVTILSLGLCCLFTVWAFGTFSYSMGSGRITVHTHLTYAYSQLSLIPGFILMAVYFLAEAVDIFRGMVSKERYRIAQEIPLPYHVEDSGKEKP